MRWAPVFAAVLGILCSAGSVSADECPLSIDVSPLSPTTSTPVSIEVSTWFPDPGEVVVSSTYERNGSQIDIGLVVQEKLSVTPVVSECGELFDCGLLPVGQYQIAADMWLIPDGSTVAEPFRVGTGSFTVVPEPSSLLLVVGGMGLLWLRRRRTR